MLAELLSLYMDKLEANLDRSEETFRAVVTLQQLMQHFPGDMDPLFQQDTIAHFRLMFQQLNELRYCGQIQSSANACSRQSRFLQLLGGCY